MPKVGRLKLFKEVRLRSAGSMSRISRSKTLRFRETTLPEVMSQAMPSQWQQSLPARHDDRFAWMKERFSWSRAEAWSGRQVVLCLAEAPREYEHKRRSAMTMMVCRCCAAGAILILDFGLPMV
jgi:hypothetical protein